MMVNLNYLNPRTGKRQNRVERGAPIGFSSVGRGALRIYSEEGLIVDGSARISGVLDGDGTLNWTGDSNLNGDVYVTKTLNVTADTNLSGPTVIDDTLDVTAETRLRGDTTLESDMEVINGGSVKVGTVMLGVTSNGRPGLDFDGATLTEDADRLAMESGTAVVGVAPTFAAVAFANKSIVVNGTRTTVNGGLALGSLSEVPAAGRTPNLWIDPASGVVSRLV
jgi:hypothetical protein